MLNTTRLFSTPVRFSVRATGVAASTVEILSLQSTDHERKKLRDIFIIGAGCAGQSLTASLLRNNTANRVFLIGRTPHIHKIHEMGLRITGAFEYTFKPSEQFVPSDAISADLLRKYNVYPHPMVFSSTKCHDAIASLTPFTHTLFSLQPTVVCLQNGLGIEQEIADAFPPSQATVLKGHIFGAMHKKENSIFTYPGRIIVGTDNPQISQELKAIFGPNNSSILNLEVFSNIAQAIYPKIIVNCVCNPLTVILNQNLGVIRTRYESLINMICNEVYDVALSQKIDLPPREEIVKIVLDTMSKFSDHYSSTYLDHQFGKRTEIEYINGAILKIADANKVNVPLTRLLVKTMQAIELKRRTCTSSEEFYTTHSLYLENIKTQLLEFTIKPNR